VQTFSDPLVQTSFTTLSGTYLYVPCILIGQSIDVLWIRHPGVLRRNYADAHVLGIKWPIITKDPNSYVQTVPGDTYRTRTTNQRFARSGRFPEARGWFRTQLAVGMTTPRKFSLFRYVNSSAP
jgi:hypothetical protein